MEGYFLSISRRHLAFVQSEEGFISELYLIEQTIKLLSHYPCYILSPYIEIAQ